MDRPCRDCVWAVLFALCFAGAVSNGAVAFDSALMIEFDLDAVRDGACVLQPDSAASQSLAGALLGRAAVTVGPPTVRISRRD